MIEWSVEKTTTDKLSAALNKISEGDNEIEKIEFVGGRDWVIIMYREAPE